MVLAGWMQALLLGDCWGVAGWMQGCSWVDAGWLQKYSGLIGSDFISFGTPSHAVLSQQSNDFSFSKELVRFVPDVLYCGARFIMGGKQTEHAHALVSRRFCSAYCKALMLLQAGVQVFKHSYTYTLA